MIAAYCIVQVSARAHTCNYFCVHSLEHLLKRLSMIGPLAANLSATLAVRREGEAEGGGGEADTPDPAAVAARLQKGPVRVTQAKIDQVKVGPQECLNGLANSCGSQLRGSIGMLVAISALMARMQCL